jgi:hypothetical protein
MGAMMMFQYLESLNGAGIAALSPSEWAKVKRGEPMWGYSRFKRDGIGQEVYDTRDEAIDAAIASIEGDEPYEVFFISCYDEDAEGQVMTISEEEVELSPDWVEEAQSFNADGYSWASSVSTERG